MTSKLCSFLKSQSYNEDFKKLILDLEKKYGEEFFNLSGIGNQLDTNTFSKKFFGANKNTADTSVDSNSNVSLKNIIVFDDELTKPLKLIYSYYRLWKGLRKKYGVEYANEAVEKQLSGEIYINDFHGFSTNKYYSYYGKTVLTIMYRNQIKTVNMENLFNMFTSFVKVYDDREEADLTNVNILVLDKGSKFVKVSRVLRHKPHNDLLKIETKNGRTTIVTEDHPVILENGSTKFAKDISIGDRLMMSECRYNIFDSKSHNIDRTKYLVGFTIGDGCLLTGGNCRELSQVSISQNSIANHKVYEYICEESPDTANSIKRHENRADMVTFGNKCWICKNAQIGKGAPNKVLPSDILNWDRNEIISLLAGLIDSDGSVNPQNGIVDIRICGFSVVQQVAEILRSLKFDRVRTSFINTQKRMGSFGSNFDMYRVSFVANDEDLIKFSDKLKQHENLITKERGVDGRYDTNEVLKVTSMQQERPEYVYDITTETGHFHCQGMIQHNCYNYSTLDTAVNGIPKGIDAEMSLPTKYLNTYFEHLQLFCVHAGASSLGAVGLADLLLTVSAYADRILTTHSDQHTIFGNKALNDLNDLIGEEWGNISAAKLEKVRDFINSKTKEEVSFASDEACWTFIKEKLTNFVYFLNQPNRIIQSLFSNVSIFDSNFIDSLIENYCIYDGDEVYRAKKENVVKIQDMFLEIMNEVMSRRITTFPVLTACISLDDDRNVLDEEFLNKMIKYNEKFCMINFYGGKTSTLSSCCRLRSDKDNKYFSTLSGAGTKIGSLGVCTLNLPRLAKLSKGDRDTFFNLVKNNVTLGQRINDIKRNILKKAIAKKMIPVYNLGYVLLKTQYSTIGINGLYEALEILGYNMATEEGIVFAGELLDHINACNDAIGDELGAPVNLEQIPAENTSIKLAHKDKLLGYNDKYKLYSNQFIPLTYTGMGSDILTKIRIQGCLDKKLSGGSILHININEKDISEDTFRELIKATFKSGTIYFAFNKLLCICADCEKVFTSNKEAMDNEEERCPVCGSTKLEHAIRIVGFIRKFSSFSEGRREEVKQRVFYDL